MKILFIGDNRNRANWGCRATSKALKDLLSRNNDVFYTIYGDIVSRGALSYKKFSSVKRLLKKLYSIKKNLKIFGSDFIVENVDRSIEKFYSIAKKNILYKEILQKIHECDAIILNGEGSFIFSIPHRLDTIFYLMWLKIAQSLSKKTYLVNAIFSDFPGSGRNLNILKQTIDILSQCTLVIARDFDSYNYLNQFEHKINLKYVPDALFSWTIYENYICNILKYQTALIPFPEHDKYWNNFDFSLPYICISGSSFAAWTQDKARIGYTKLVQVLKERHYNLFIVPACSGDKFLYDVAEQTKVPIIPVNTNILGGMAILANATVFISGRWHPSILASLGGTPCVILGSNSHKTMSFLNMMDYEKRKEYSAIPTEEEIPSILNDIQDYIRQGSALRNKIKTKATELSELTCFYTTLGSDVNGGKK
jgi:polysaccharide pyruvyl transferase WcaK-like protein